MTRLDKLTGDAIRLPQLDELRSKVSRGFVLTGEAGCGKSTSLQLLGGDLARAHLKDPGRSRAPILFAIRLWRTDRTLEQAIHEHVDGFAPISERALRAAMAKGELIVILDGADELWGKRVRGVSQEIDELRARYPHVGWIVSSRSNYPPPAHDLEVVQMREPTAEEATEIQRRRRRL